MRSYRHRETKGHNYSNRQAALSYVSNMVSGVAAQNEPFSLCHKSSAAQRKQDRRTFRQDNDFTPRRTRTVVAYGNASIMGTMKAHTPIPIKVTLYLLYSPANI